MTAHLQLFMILGAIVLLLIIFALLKRGLMSVKYSLLWLALAVGLVIAAAFPYVVYVLRDLLDIEMPVNLVFLLMFCFVLVVLLSRRAIDPVVRSAQQQKQFITDASHELKTPITVIATSLKVLEMEVGQQKWIDKAQIQTEKLTELVNSLVTLSRMDEEDSPLKMESFPVSDAVSETAESFRDLALSRGHPLELTVQPELTYRGDEYAVRQLTSILLDNAVKYAAPESPITLTLEKGRKGVVLRQSNRCAEPESIDPAKLFDRFYQADPSRGAGGFGIGLSIARSIAEGHRGTIRAAVSGDTITFTAELK